jgi:hypothetical protein
MAKRKRRPYNGQKKKETIQWPKEKGDHTMAKRKRRPYNGQKKKGQTMIHKTSDPTTCTARKTVGELRCSYIIYIFVYV